jgi:hypothetical protein
LAQRKQKYMRYANATLKLDLIRISLTQQEAQARDAVS